MNWKNINDGYEFLIYFKQGQHSGCTVEKIHCSLQDEEHFQKTVKILQYLQDGIERYFESYTEKVAEYISQKTGINEKEICDIIMDIVLSDMQFEEHMALVDHIEVYRYENGTVQTARI